MRWTAPRAGAAIIHSHVDTRLVGQDAADAYLRSWSRVRAERSDVILCPTSTRSRDVVEKWSHVPLLAPHGIRMGVCDPGSTNLADSRPDGTPGDRGAVYANAYADIAYVLDQLRQTRLGPSFAVYEPGFLRTILAYERAGRVPAGALVKLYFGGAYNWFDGSPSGASFGLPPTRAGFEAYMDMLAGSRLEWAVAVIGGDVIETGVAALALERGGHLRVGIEDFIGPLQPRNVDLVREASALCAAAGRPVATPAEAATLLGLPRPVAEGRSHAVEE